MPPLETRRGRCGEWANCFALILRSFGYLTRHVNDFSDHVWCEFYSETENRWKHVDPCEGIVDKPKVYENGWGKKLNYVIAVSIYEVQDVTKRYVMNFDKEKRNLVDEDWLNKLVMEQTDLYQKNLKDSGFKTKLAQMRLVELAEFMFAKKSELSKEEGQGRTSGSLAWRLARQEIKTGGNFVIEPTEKELEIGEIDLEYCIVQDFYKRKYGENVSGWNNLTFEVENLFKKEEKDWKMVYLARNSADKQGRISWKVDLSKTKLKIKSVELLIQSKVFENGKIVWQLLGDENKAILPTPGKHFDLRQFF